MVCGIGLCQCAEECLTYEAEDRSTIDEIEEWLDDIVEHVGVPDCGVESLLEDVVPVKRGRKPSVGARKLTLDGKPSRANTPKFDDLLDSIRATRDAKNRAKIHRLKKHVRKTRPKKQHDLLDGPSPSPPPRNAPTVSHQ